MNLIEFLILQVALYQVRTWRRSLLLLVFVPQRAFHYMQLEAIIRLIQAMGVFVGTLHWVVAQKIETEIATWKGAPLGVMNRNVHFEIEFVKVQGLQQEKN